jgi:hypothetical protein
LAVKLLYLTLGLTGALWPAFGGDGDAWHQVRRQPAAGWALAAVAAAATGYWIVRGRHTVRSRRLDPVAGGLSLGLVWPFVLGSVAIVALTAFTGVVDTSTPKAVGDVIGWIADRGVNGPRLPIIVAALIGLAALMRRRVPSWALLCVVFALWSLPLFVASFTSRKAAAPFVFGPGTFDVALTFGLAPALLWAHRERRHDLTAMLVWGSSSRPCWHGRTRSPPG